MAADAVYDAIKTFLGTPANVAILAGPDGAMPKIRFENEAFDQPNPPAPWIAMALTGVLYGQASIGAATQAANRWDEEGRLWIPVFVPVGTGASRAHQLAKALADLFRGLTLLNGDLEFMDSFIGEAGPASEEGNWFQLPLIVKWRRVES
jgi:hypothetical protein